MDLFNESELAFAGGASGDLVGPVNVRERAIVPQLQQPVETGTRLQVYSMPNCGPVVRGGHLARHLHRFRRMFEQEARRLIHISHNKPPETATRSSKAVQCPLLGQVCSKTNKPCTTRSTTRLDQHLRTYHGLLKDSPRYLELRRNAPVAVASSTISPELSVSENEIRFNRIVADFCKSMGGRSGGSKSAPATLLCHRSALRRFLPIISGPKLRELKLIGEFGGQVDRLINSREYAAKTLKTYLSSLHTFIEWLGSADDSAVATRADTWFAIDECVALGITLRNIMKSLTVDINKRQVERGAVSAPQPQETLTEAWQEQVFQESESLK